MIEVRSAGTVGELIGAWLPRQRWFSAKGGNRPVLAPAGELWLPGPVAGDGAGVAVHFVTATVDDVRATYQVPLTYHRGPVPGLEHALIGILDPGPAPDGPADPAQPDGPAQPDDRRLWVYDGPHDPAFVRAWLALVGSRGEVVSDDGPAGCRAVGATQSATATVPVRPAATPTTATPTGAVRPTGSGAAAPGSPRWLDPDRPSRVLSGEQSNTSVIVSGDDDPEPVILKVFRVLQSGANPDVAVTSVLTAEGCPNVPRLAGWVDGEWRDPAGSRAYGHLTSVSEFLPDSRDAWQMACVAVENGQSFTEQARGIGTATAAVHASLARALPTAAADGSTLDDLAGHLRCRLEWALAAVPRLHPYADAARAAVDAVREVGSVPRLQRIHGDLHLGQVLEAGERGWVLLDFEGEPLRPLADRNRQDLPLRDIAGMLRSFDYAARHATIRPEGSGPGPDPAGTWTDASVPVPVHAGADAWADASTAERAAAWAAECAQAFLDAYAAAGDRDPRDDAVLLRALELDKALYEAVYETRNRPAWTPIPVSAVARLLEPVG